MWRGVALLATGCVFIAYSVPSYDELHSVGKLLTIVAGAVLISLGLVVLTRSRMPSW